MLDWRFDQQGKAKERMVWWNTVQDGLQVLRWNWQWRCSKRLCRADLGEHSQEGVAEICNREFSDKFELRMTEGGASFGAATLAGAGRAMDLVMGRVSPRGMPARKLPPRGRSGVDLASMA